MSIRYRLLLSYVGLITIPVILIIILNSIFGFVSAPESAQTFEAYKPWHHFQKIAEQNILASREINRQMINNKKKIISKKFLNEIDDGLEKNYSGIILRSNNKVMYVSDSIQTISTWSNLPVFGQKYDKEKFFNMNEGYIINEQMDFSIDNKNYSLFIIADIGNFRNKMRGLEKLVTSVIIGLLVFTSLFLTYIIYKDIKKSLDKLKKATDKIKRGNLDYKVEKHLNDEIGEVSEAFEKMRLRLKSSIEIQNKYEMNRKRLISNISHDLRTPIMSIKGYVEGIRDGIADTPEKMNKYLNTIHEKAKDMEGMIEELFLFSNLDLKKEEFNFRNVDIIEFLQYCIEDLSFDLKKVDGCIRLRTDKKSILVKVDPQKLKRVILNIINNSIKYKRNIQLEIDIFVRNIEDKVIIQIKDNGKGISEENLSYIFERFYRGDKCRNSSIKGSGLGLAISKQIIKKHGGKIWVESQKDKGTSIYFALNVIKEEMRSEEDINY